MIFVDTNILVYAYLDNDLPKYEKARKAIIQDSHLINFFISTQVLNEFCAIFSKSKYRDKNINDYYFEILNSYNILQVDVSTISKAITLQKQYGTSWWDALMISSALEYRCNILYTEDLGHIVNIENRLNIINSLA